ncbi:TetR/AcrR family transcriptional regulator [Tomitella biformata]|uniref:TetR/AcrR family transcriptional regulator n=1 Tax=Tomitella biformata TaxID=630403 RepID=UPI0004656B95|nr:TetR/AcrR family transcriptional regulator [Tomitella biformata]
MTASPQLAEVAVARGPGRPRDEDLDGQLIQATLELIDAEQEVTVSRIVAHSGVSRAAIYRRWPSITGLIAEALDRGRTVPPGIPAVRDLREELLAMVLGGTSAIVAAENLEARFRKRIRLVMADRALQEAYWTSHVARRRVPTEAALRRGINLGLLQPDLDVTACVDALAGVAYYQLVARGVSLEDPATQERLRAAVEILWRGIVRE